jgi:hypothetical protein
MFDENKRGNREKKEQIKSRKKGERLVGGKLGPNKHIKKRNDSLEDYCCYTSKNTSSRRALRLLMAQRPCAGVHPAERMAGLTSTTSSTDTVRGEVFREDVIGGAALRVAELGLDTDIVVRELAHLRVVNAENLGLLIAAEAEAGDEVHDPEDDGRHHEGVAETGRGVGELVGELDVVVVEPAAGDDGRTVVVRHRGLCEETGEEVANDATNSVRRKDLRNKKYFELIVPFRYKGEKRGSHQDSRHSRRGT